MIVIFDSRSVIIIEQLVHEDGVGYVACINRSRNANAERRLSIGCL